MDDGQTLFWRFFFLFFSYGFFLTDTDYTPKLLVSVSTRVVLCRRLHENSWQAGKAGSRYL